MPRDMWTSSIELSKLNVRTWIVEDDTILKKSPLKWYNEFYWAVVLFNLASLQ
jgi:hypothetical protein